MSTILRNERMMYASLTLSFLGIFVLEFCYSLGKLHTLDGAFSNTVLFSLPLIPMFLISCALLLNKKIKTIK